MEVLLYLIPAALGMGAVGLVAFLWALKSGQFEDLDGAANRILFEDDEPGPPPVQPSAASGPASLQPETNDLPDPANAVEVASQTEKK
ncbi:MAG: cbb3-type cytochrome oxidase assembly protein CcoS [Rhodospirillaceae bacterium]